MSRRRDSVAVRQLNPIHKKSPVFLTRFSPVLHFILKPVQIKWVFSIWNIKLDCNGFIKLQAASYITVVFARNFKQVLKLHEYGSRIIAKASLTWCFQSNTHLEFFLTCLWKTLHYTEAYFGSCQVSLIWSLTILRKSLKVL